jgi:hypothetical protein
MRPVDPARLWFRMPPARLAGSHSSSPGGYSLGLMMDYAKPALQPNPDSRLTRLAGAPATASVSATQQPAMHELPVAYTRGHLDLASLNSL